MIWNEVLKLPEINRLKTNKKIDIIKDDVGNIDRKLLKLLLKDKTTKENILWATKDYEDYGVGYDERVQMSVDLITGYLSDIIQQRATKTKEIQKNRIKNRAEVFTPSWVCNKQNNLVDEAWFGYRDIFNKPIGTGWETTKETIRFPDNKDWRTYVNANRLEITCGEAPYLVSRYDTTTGEYIPINERIGLFDRKMRVVNENCNDNETWLRWSLNALKSIYGYEFQGDSLLIARENMLYSYIDYFKERFDSEPSMKLLETVINIITWNMWQMDGLRFVVPYSCIPMPVIKNQISLFDDEIEDISIPCPGCRENDIFKHNGIYCRIFDWKKHKKSVLFIDVLKEGEKSGNL